VSETETLSETETVHATYVPLWSFGDVRHVGRKEWLEGWQESGARPETMAIARAMTAKGFNHATGGQWHPKTASVIALMERILSASSDEGDVVLDPFCGCGTTIDAAVRLKRNWVGIDVTYIAVDLIAKRLIHTYGAAIGDTYEVHGIPRDLGGAKALFDASPFDFERWAVSLMNAQPNQKQVGDKGVDGVARFPLDAKGSVGRVLASVKGGKTIGPQFMRDLLGTVHSQKAEMGVLITMAEPTRGIIDAAAHAGSYIWPINGESFPKIQIITVADLLAGKKPKMPATLTPYIQAQKLKISPDQMTLGI